MALAWPCAGTGPPSDCEGFLASSSHSRHRFFESPYPHPTVSVTLEESSNLIKVMRVEKPLGQADKLTNRRRVYCTSIEQGSNSITQP